MARGLLAVVRRLGRAGDDRWGMVLVMAGVLAGLGIYADLLGPAGHTLQTGTAWTIGLARFLVPVGLVGVGVRALAAGLPGGQGPATGSPTGPQAVTGSPTGRSPVAVSGLTPGPGASRARLGRSVVALAVTLAAIAGLVDLVRGTSGAGAPRHVLRMAGGELGTLDGHLLQTALGPWGAGIVVVMVLAVSLLALAGVPARRAITIGGAAVVRATKAGIRAGRWGRVPAVAAEVGDEQCSGDSRVSVLFDGAPFEADPAAPGRQAGPSPSRGRLPAHPGPSAGPGGDSDDEPGTNGDGGASDHLGKPAAISANPDSWKLPSLDLLSKSRSQVVDRREVDLAGQALVSALGTHGVVTRLVGQTVGPTVTRYELELGPGVKVARVTTLSKDIAYAMASADVRILAPIPGRSAIGIEVPNRHRQLVTLADILTSDEARLATHPLEVALGRDIAGRAVLVNLAEMPHILIAGATGAGKSSCINSLVTSILTRATPEQVRLILVDPKRVELGQYNGLPHLLTPVVVNPKRAANALSWAVHEMERRYDLLAEARVRDITGYNQALAAGDLLASGGAPAVSSRSPADQEEMPQPLPFILVVVDELNDLMMVAARDVEQSICRIAQMARAVGIHLVIATQRPSVDVITGVIKANVPSRLAFSVSSLADSRVILDQPGAERLVGKGDLLLVSASSNVPRRLQGPWVAEAEVRAVVAHWRRQSEPRYLDGVEGDDRGGDVSRLDEGDDDDLIKQAMELVVRSKLGSTSMLQRKLRVGFARAGRLMDLLERRGVVGPSEGSKSRAVLMSPEELDQL